MRLPDLYKLLADEYRLRMIYLLRFQPLCVCHLQAILGMTQTNTSRNLALLRAHQVVEVERRGAWKVYRLTSKLSRELKVQIAALEQCAKWEPIFDRDLDLLRTMDLDVAAAECAADDPSTPNYLTLLTPRPSKIEPRYANN